MDRTRDGAPEARICVRPKAGFARKTASTPNPGDPMNRRTAQEFDQELLDIYDYYVHGQIDRRGFLDRAAKFAVGGLTAAALLEMLNPQYAFAAQVPKEDSRVSSEYLKY